MHTPGPWVADDGDGQYFGVFADSNGEPIAMLVEPASSARVVILPRDEEYEKFSKSTDVAFATTWKPHQRLAEHKANALLIAAAPELLAFARKVFPLLDRLSLPSEESPAGNSVAAQWRDEAAALIRKSVPNS